MKLNSIKRFLAVGMLIGALVTLLGWSYQRHTKVFSFPLDCYTQGEKTICIDGRLSAEMVCEELSSQTVICSEKI
ncbi:MAG: hypothetical protein JRJ87_08185 [Deltaproteobacteria bacterium]|nr:hypothetical protein [Deltaproteobacteria bacterium]